MATNLKPPIVRRVQIYDRFTHTTRGKVTHLVIFQPGFFERWTSICGRLVDYSSQDLRDNHHLRLCKDCENRLRELNALVPDPLAQQIKDMVRD